MSSAWNLQFESLQNQVGTVDALETLSAAYSPDGWLGGLDGVSRILARHPNTNLERFHVFQGCLRLQPVSCTVATGEGLRRCLIEDAEYAFGGNVHSQFIGLTICALSYECDGGNAVELFMDIFGPYIFDGLDEIKLAIYIQLNQNYVRILNEGAARGLTDQFTEAIAPLNILNGDRAWLRKALASDRELLSLPSEAAMLGGLLKWMAKCKKGTYRTRSSLVARAAACLKVVGHRIGEIQVRAGAGACDGDDDGDDDDDDDDDYDNLIPNNTHTDLISVVLVLGGSLASDPLQLRPEDIVARQYTLHYDYHTVGSMLLSALSNQSDVDAKVYQEQFEEIYDFFERNLSVKYELSPNILSPLQARASWKGNGLAHDEDIETRLAEFYFPRSSERLSFCYRQMATEEALDEITENLSSFGNFGDCFPESLSMFRAITAAIVISFASRLAPRNFKTTRHCITIDLENDGWLEEICEVADKVMAEGIESEPLLLEQAVFTLAAIHAGADPEEIKKAEHDLIGWRNGIYTIIPSLLVDMIPTSEAGELQCLDTFLANVMVGDSGRIMASMTPALSRKDEEEDTENVSTPSSTVVQDSGPPIPGPPDVPLSISFGAPLHINGPHLCLRASVEGSIVGAVGIKEVLSVLASSQGEPSECSHQTPSATTVVTVKPSAWAVHKKKRPISREHRTFVPVQGDRAWAIYIAGEVSWLSGGGRIVYRCVDCAVGYRAPQQSETRGSVQTEDRGHVQSENRVPVQSENPGPVLSENRIPVQPEDPGPVQSENPDPAQSEDGSTSADYWTDGSSTVIGDTSDIDDMDTDISSEWETDASMSDFDNGDGGEAEIGHPPHRTVLIGYHINS